ncbi:MAG: DUF4089 domain-containing protein [Cyanobacteriota bacterium]
MPENTVEIAEYVEVAAQLLNVPLTAQYREGVVDNFVRIAAIAKQVNDFPLPEEIEPASIFEP